MESIKSFCKASLFLFEVRDMIENEKLERITGKLLSLSSDDRDKELDNTFLGDLEEIAVYLYINNLTTTREIRSQKKLLNEVLRKRCKKKNNDFIWTEENKQKFLKVNDELFCLFKQAYKKALAEAEKLEKQIDENDFFIKDYEIEIKMKPSCNDPEIDDITITDVISDSIFPNLIRDDISHCHYKDQMEEESIFLDRSMNWNREGAMKIIFSDRYISYAMYMLLGTRHWSYEDIVNVRTIWVDVEVTHQSFVVIK